LKFFDVRKPNRVAFPAGDNDRQMQPDPRPRFAQQPGGIWDGEQFQPPDAIQYLVKLPLQLA
jgi:hypothetical protein